MGISGNLKTMQLAELLQWLSQGQKTGTLVIDGGKVKKRIFFEDGVIISSASTDPKEYLGHFLTSHGYITDDEANAAVARQKEEKQLLGQILVGMGAISEEELQQVLQQKAEESIYDIFTWAEGDFNFLDDELPAETMIRMHLDVQWIVLEGSRRMDEWTRIREWVPSPLCVPVLVIDLDALEEEIEEVDRRILEWIDDDRSVEDISQGAQTSLFLIAQTLAEAVQKGYAKVVRPRIIEVEVPAAEGESAKPDAAPQPPPPQHPQYPQGYPPQMMPPMGYPGMPQGYPMPGYAQGGGMGQGFTPPAGVSGGSTHIGSRTLKFAGAGDARQQAPKSEADALLEKAEEALSDGNLDRALESFRKAKTADGSSPSISSTADEGEKKVAAALERGGVKLSSVPKLNCTEAELTQLDISPQQGFMLTRVDGSYDIKSILKMCPMPGIDAQILFWRLRKSGHVSI